MSFIIGLAIGIAIGWVVFERPQLATDAINWIKSKLHVGTIPPPPPAVP